MTQKKKEKKFRKEVELTEGVIDLLEKEAKENFRSLKAHNEAVLTQHAEAYEDSKKTKK